MKSFSFLGGLFVAAIVFAVNSSSASAQEASAPSSPPVNVVVQPGDNLSKIAETHQTTHVRLFDANLQIEDPDLIYVGDTLRIPAANEDLASRVVAATPAPPKRLAKSVKPIKNQAKIKTRKVAVAANFDAGVWDRLARCEAGGNWGASSGNGYYGGLQFSAQTWRGVGGSGYPHQASKAEQITRGKALQARSGWGQWPSCSAKLGLR